MKKTILMGMLIGALLIFPIVNVNATTEQPKCESWMHYEGSQVCQSYGEATCASWSTPECLSWSTPTCTSGHHVCTHWWHWMCTNWDWQCDTWSQSTCLSYSTPTCLSYNAPQCAEWAWEGLCVDNKGDESTNGGSSGGASIYQLVPQFGWITVNNRNVQFLSSKFGIGGILLNDQSIPYPVNEFGKPITTWMSQVHVSLMESSYSYGYKYAFEEESERTYHDMVIPNTVPAGHYFGRVWFWGHYTGVAGDLGAVGSQYDKVFSKEFELTIN